MNKELKPCPFCGSTDTDVLRSTDGVKFWGRCETCGAVGGVGSTDEEAAKLWNQRKEGEDDGVQDSTCVPDQ